MNTPGHPSAARADRWDVGSKRRLGEALQLAGDSMASLAFDHDGSALHVADQNGTVYDLPVTGEQIAAAVCARAGRSLTRQEWQTYLQDIPYRDMCRTVWPHSPRDHSNVSATLRSAGRRAKASDG
jgi:hypothetical protein